MASSGCSGASKRKRKRDRKKLPQFSGSHNTSVSVVSDPVTAVSGLSVEKLGAGMVLESGSCEDGSSQVKDSSTVLEVKMTPAESHFRTREVPQNPLNCSKLSPCSSSKFNIKPASESKVKAKKGTPLSPQNHNTTTQTLQSTVDITDTNCSTFEHELDWCIGQLQLGLLRPNAKKHQKEENERYIKTLSSSKTLLPKKRQIMRNLFGDYRAKMKTHPLPDKLQDPEISCVEKDSLEVTGKFYKLSATLARKAMKNELESDGTYKNAKDLDRTTCHTPSGGFESDRRGFQFNFEIENMDSLES